QQAGVQQPVPQVELVWSSLLSVTAQDRTAPVEVKLRFRLKKQLINATFHWHPNGQLANSFNYEDGTVLQPKDVALPQQWLARMQFYALAFSSIPPPAAVNSAVSLQPNGAGLAAVLDDLKDTHPERWELLLAEMCQWLPEYDYILFDKPQ